MCVFSSHSFWTSSSLDVPAGGTQEEGHTGFLIHLLSAVRTLIFLARKIQPLPSLVDREVEFNFVYSGRLFCIRKTYTKMDQIRFFFRDQKHERRPSYAYGFGLLCFRQTRTGLPMRVRYSNEIAEWKWPPVFQNKRVRYARKSRRAGPLQ